ncbi:hypothetical protein G8A07_15625 [Roseateles sp. DAIF2]|uniref:hypothetical protein n=1 Tax=Roseateles sp. DAIF2 TaxID=2714952 RepID=UPI0018A31BAC|nr:hypothetical protein [Roseateles sp. DAIF2]QPF74205.1 hypothetical protein G8A07_15625 [Roseateles sp. DAIF2]
MSSIEVAKSAAGFLTATERPRCGNCKHHSMQYVDRMPPYDRAGMRCKRGGFAVSAYAICNGHEPERLGGQGAPA